MHRIPLRFWIAVVVATALVSCGSKPPVADTPIPTMPTSSTVAVQPTLVATDLPMDTNTLQTVLARESLRCGIEPNLSGFSAVDEDGDYTGFDADFCRAIAAGILGDASQVEFVPLESTDQFPALQNGKVDVLIRAASWTLTRDANLGLDFTTTTFYDALGYLVRKNAIRNVDQLDGGTICVQSSANTEMILGADFGTRGIGYIPNVLTNRVETYKTFFEGECEAVVAEKSELAAMISQQEDADQYVILPDAISKEAFGPIVRANDSAWRDVVTWTLYAMIQADESGVDQNNIDEMLRSDDLTIQRLLGSGEDNLGSLLGIPKDWVYQIIKQVGSYSDVYARNLEPIGIARENTLNALWSDGGLMYSPAFR